MHKTHTKIHSWLNRHEHTRRLLIVLLIALCALEVRSLVLSLRDTYQQGESYIKYQNGQILRMPEAVSVTDIQAWMTFRYINFVFKLPETYLATSFRVTDPRYPDIQLARYARMNKINDMQFLLEVQQAVAAFKH